MNTSPSYIISYYQELQQEFQKQVNNKLKWWFDGSYIMSISVIGGSHKPASFFNEFKILFEESVKLIS